ncbi:glycoside hydrolase family 15 protein [Labedaea rhizosphaerae]|uniref:GH15 family glucan-1,4-alpha-glucosidase n=1 Tax=Labedaea rhizosphaerae TaxID=598644 RepID=A0A4V3CZN1_LABRH|nr:glycoside hydrolase family 15 protein [Labedaea rhizosphaerae]TDQ00361.1 GH15 family glucan-1,4-alpha-glucosidase [Labedaea rhizosphaerae]
MTSLIEDYALLGDLQTAALLGRDGSIDWLCLPRFDSPACFAALLHDERAGRWALAPTGAGPATRRGYEPDTLIMRSEWATETGTVRVVDFMPPRGEAADVVRIVEGVSGRTSMSMQLDLRFDYGRIVPWMRTDGDDLVAVAGPDAVWLRTPVQHVLDRTKGPDGQACVSAEFTVAAGERIPFVLTYRASHESRPKPVDAETALEDTRRFWLDWISRCDYTGDWREEVRRALITLKALTYAPTGGILAAATTSLPEQLGGSRNWDYRYCWLRDATFTLQALVGTGYHDEALAWREWLVRAVAGDPGDLQIMYTVDGARRTPECTVDWLDGYQGSAPVRIGNAAAEQFQLDVWGEVLTGLHLVRENRLPTSHAAWDLQRGLLDYLEGHWREPDDSLWEIRGNQRHFVHSKVLAWAGVDRAVRAARHPGFRDVGEPVERWQDLADHIHQDVCAHGYDPDRDTFTQFYGSRGLDAALLLLPRVGFLPWTDPRIRGTISAVRRDLEHDGLLMRYDPGADASEGRTIDGVPGTENPFLVCSFWLADALYQTGKHNEARDLFERLLSLRNDVGLLSEQYDTTHKRQTGNTPQAFSMVGIVNTARHLGGADPTTSQRMRQGS